MDKLIEGIKQKGNPSVIGLDPKIEYVPKSIREKSYKKHGETLKGAAHAILRFNRELIDAICDIVPAVKPQSAYYEMYGIPGIKVLHKTIQYAKQKGLYVITDAKRNDIGSTAAAYAAAYLGNTVVETQQIEAFSSDAVTVNPYLGTDGMQPFIEMCNEHQKSIFTLVKTSNPSSGELQDLLVEGEPIYSRVANLVDKWGQQSIGKYGYNNVGAVVGATYPEQAAMLRKQMPNTYFLVPGYGAQGGTADDVVPCFNADRLGAIVNSSRGIMCAYMKNGYDEKDFAKAARKAAIEMKNQIAKALG